MGDSALATLTQVGFTLGGFVIAGPFGAAVGAGLGAYIAGELFGPPDIDVSSGRLASLKVATSEYGRPVPVVYGCVRVGGSAFFNSDLIEKKNTTSETPGKGGGPSVNTTTFHYSIDIGYLMTASPASFPVVAMPQGWANGKLLWDFSNLTGPIFSAKYIGETGGPFSQGTIRIRHGDQDQLPDSLYEVYGGVGTTPSGRGSSEVILEDFPLEDFGNAPPQITAVVCTAKSGLFPTASLTWTQNTNAIRFAPDGRTITTIDTDTQPELVNSDTREFIIAPNTITLEPLVGTGNSDGNNPYGFFEIDQFGRGLSFEDSLGSVTTPFLHRVDTYAIIARSAFESSGVVGAGTKRRFFGLNSERIFLVGSTAQKYAVYNSGNLLVATEGVDGLTFTGPLIPLVVAARWDDHSPAIANTVKFAMDGQTGHLWTFHTSGGDTILVHWSLDFVEIERFTATGRLVASSIGTDSGYEPITHSFILKESDTVLWRWSIDDEAIFATVYTADDAFGDISSPLSSIHNGVMYAKAGVDIQSIDLVTMTFIKKYDMTDWSAVADRSPLYDPYLHAVIFSRTSNTPVTWVFLDREVGGPTTLEAILNEEVLISGYEGGSNDRDATDHTSTSVLGWSIISQSPVVQSSQEQADVYKFGHVESDHKIKFPARGRATTFALVDADLGVTAGGSGASRKLSITRTDRSKEPLQSEIKFFDPDLDYQEGFQRATIVPDTVPGTLKISSRSFPLVITNAEAQQREFLHLTERYTDQQKYSCTVFHSKLAIDPGDTGTITSDGVTHLVMAVDTSLGANFQYEIQAVGFAIPTAAEADAILTELYTLETELSAQTPDGFIDQTPDQANATKLVMLDRVFLDDTVNPGNDKLVTQMVAQRTVAGAAWSGADIQKSPDNSVYSSWHFYEAAFEGEIGAVSTALGDQERWTVLDTTSTVDVQFRGDLVLASVSDVALYNGENAFLIGDELILAATVVDNGSGNWTLSRMLRGRRGSEFARSTHTKWEHAIYLGTLALLNKAMARSSDLGDLNVSYFYRAQSVGAVSGFGFKEEFTNMGDSLKPYAPANVAGVKSGSDWTFSWEMRTRVGGEMRDLADAQESDPNIYEIDILAEDDTTILRTITTTASANGSVVSGKTATYDQLDLESDFSETPIAKFYPIYRIAINVYQVNAATVGRGFVARAEIEDFPDPVADDASFSSVSLLIHCNSLTVKDRSSNKLPITTGSALTLISGDYWDSNSQYGSAVVNFSNTLNSVLRIDRANLGTLFDFGAGDFTLEIWGHMSVIGTGVIVGVWGLNGQEEWLWEFRGGGGPNGHLRFTWTTDGSAESNEQEELPGPTGDAGILGLNHFAFTRSGTTGRLYFNGAQLGSNFTLSGTIFSGGTADLTVGVENNGTTDEWSGRLDSMRITKGVARYTAATYTMPQTRFANN